ncbi:unnamed protein product, partial [Rotaria sp. Silwood1]
MNSAELYDPSTASWTTSYSMNYNRWYHTASTLTNGKVIIAGGRNNSIITNSTEIYDPSTG